MGGLVRALDARRRLEIELACLLIARPYVEFVAARDPSAAHDAAWERRRAEEHREAMRLLSAHYVSTADIVFSTLSGTGRPEMLDETFPLVRAARGAARKGGHTRELMGWSGALSLFAPMLLGCSGALVPATPSDPSLSPAAPTNPRRSSPRPDPRCPHKPTQALTPDLSPRRTNPTQLRTLSLSAAAPPPPSHR
jgi:hypothetical protein